MRATFIVVVVIFALFIASPASACQECAEHYTWPWLEDCWFCDQTNCGGILCELHDSYCQLQGDCNEGGRYCPDIMNPPPSAMQSMPGPRRSTGEHLSDRWLLVRVRVARKAVRLHG